MLFWSEPSLYLVYSSVLTHTHIAALRRTKVWLRESGQEDSFAWDWPSVIDIVRAGVYHLSLHLKQLITGKEDTANNSFLVREVNAWWEGQGTTMLFVLSILWMWCTPSALQSSVCYSLTTHAQCSLTSKKAVRISTSHGLMWSIFIIDVYSIRSTANCRASFQSDHTQSYSTW